MTDTDTDSGSAFTMAQRRELAQRVEAASSIQTEGKETGISVAGGEDEYTVSSYKATVVRSLLRHSLGDVNWVTVEAEYALERYSDRLPPEDVPVVGVSVTLPVGTLSIKGTARSNNHHSSIVSTPDEVEQAREAFSDE